MPRRQDKLQKHVQFRKVQLSSTFHNASIHVATSFSIIEQQLMSEQFAANENVPLTSCDRRKQAKLPETFINRMA